MGSGTLGWSSIQYRDQVPTVYARLTIDVTPEMRARIKVAAFQSETTVAELVRRLLEREFASGDCAALL